MTTIGVVIPYFQRRPGILRRALDSLLAQRLPEGVSVHLLLVDDASPAPVADELTDLKFEGAFRYTLITQPNQGVAGARNAGLDRLGEDATYVAFLDSDDIWHPDHLAQGISALDLGYDLYFTDHSRLGHHSSHFSDIEDKTLIDRIIDGRINETVESVNRDRFFSQSLRYFLAQLSTVIYRRAKATNLRFDHRLDAAGEDSLFILRLTASVGKICLSKRVMVTCADGINIYYSRFSWDDSGHLIRFMGIVLMLETFKSLPLKAVDRAFLAGDIRRRHLHFAFLTLRYFLKKREKWPDKLRVMTKEDPAFWRWYPASLTYVALGKILNFYKPELK